MSNFAGPFPWLCYEAELTELHFQFLCCCTFYSCIITISSVQIHSQSLNCQGKWYISNSSRKLWLLEVHKLCHETQELREQTLLAKISSENLYPAPCFPQFTTYATAHLRANALQDRLYALLLQFSFDVKTLQLVRTSSCLLRLYTWNSILDMH